MKKLPLQESTSLRLDTQGSVIIGATLLGLYDTHKCHNNHETSPVDVMLFRIMHHQNVFVVGLKKNGAKFKT